MILYYIYIGSLDSFLPFNAQGAAREPFFRSHEAHFIGWQCHLWLRADSCLRGKSSHATCLLQRHY